MLNFFLNPICFNSWGRGVSLKSHKNYHRWRDALKIFDPHLNYLTTHGVFYAYLPFSLAFYGFFMFIFPNFLLQHAIFPLFVKVGRLQTSPWLNVKYRSLTNSRLVRFHVSKFLKKCYGAKNYHLLIVVGYTGV